MRDRRSFAATTSSSQPDNRPGAFVNLTTRQCPKGNGVDEVGGNRWQRPKLTESVKSRFSGCGPDLLHGQHTERVHRHDGSVRAGRQSPRPSWKGRCREILGHDAAGLPRQHRQWRGRGRRHFGQVERVANVSSCQCVRHVPRAFENERDLPIVVVGVRATQSLGKPAKDVAWPPPDASPPPGPGCRGPAPRGASSRARNRP